MAAVLAAGDGAALSHTSAAALWQFLRPIPGPVHVTIGAAVRRRPRPGLRLHRSRTLTPNDIVRRHGIAVTTPARTITDLRTAVEPYLFRRALRQAELAGHHVPHLATTRRTRSDLELRFLALCESHGLPRPLVNHRLHGHACDLALRAHGIETRRYTGEQLESDPAAVVADLRAAIGLAAAVT
jgi:hypothetical protein